VTKNRDAEDDTAMWLTREHYALGHDSCLPCPRAVLVKWPSGEPSRSLVIGIAGGSGSGKTTISESVLEEVGPDAVLIQHDSYYRHNPGLPFEERTKINYDHPDSLETDLLVKHVSELVAGAPVDIPVYDFNQHVRSDETRNVKPAPVILLEGILVLAEVEMRALMDLKIYVDTESDVRLARRLSRDITERGRSAESVISQYLETVRPMHLQFVEPSKRYADLIVPEGYNPGAVGTVIHMIQKVAAGGDLWPR